MKETEWRPRVGSSLRTTTSAEVLDVVAHFDGDGYGECFVVKRQVLGGWTTGIVTRSDWERRRYIVLSSAGRAAT